jgi:hypothetical protein
MGQISDAKLQMVRGLVELAPDAAVRNLLLALSATDGNDEGLARVLKMVEVEAADRQARNLVFAPIAPLCSPPTPFRELSFPPRTLGLLWKGLKATQADDVAAAKAQVDKWTEPQEGPEALDRLCAAASAGLRADHSAFAAAIQAADAGAGRETLAACLDIAAVTRGALAHMPEWLGRMTSEKTAKLRLAYKDAVSISADAGPRFFEMLAAHLTEPWLILRVISGAMDHPGEAYLAASELSAFGERVLSNIDRLVGEVAAFKTTDGRQAAHAAAAAIHQTVIEIAEIEQSVGLSPEGPWGKRVSGQKKLMSGAVEKLLKETETLVAKALPTKTVRVGPRTTRGVPVLNAEPDQAQVEKAATLLIFLDEVRTSAAAGGVASVRAKVLEDVEARLDAYVEELLAEIRADDGIDQTRAHAFLEVAAEFCGLARDEKAAQIVRRRANAAA